MSRSLAPLLVALALGCAAPVPSLEGSGAETIEQEVRGGTTQSAYEATGVLLGGPSPQELSPFCTATLIAPDAVVTAGHCLDYRPAELHVGFGVPGSGAEVRVTGAFYHPDYAYPGPAYDVAVLLLEHAVSHPVAQLAPMTEGCGLRGVGYGQATATEPDAGSTRRSFAACVVPGGGAGLQRVVRGTDGGPCPADSGGPLFVDGTDFIVGVVSGIASSPEQTECGAGVDNVYAELDPAQEFVECVLARGREQVGPGVTRYIDGFCPAQRWVRCARSGGCSVWAAHDLGARRGAADLLGTQPSGTVMGVFGRSGDAIVVSYPMADRGYDVQVVDASEWTPAAQPGSPSAPPPSGTNDEWIVCDSPGGCEVYEAPDVDAAPRLLGRVTCGTEMGVFFADRSDEVGRYVVSYPMPDRDHALQVVGTTDRAWVSVRTSDGTRGSFVPGC